MVVFQTEAGQLFAEVMGGAFLVIALLFASHFLAMFNVFIRGLNSKLQAVDHGLAVAAPLGSPQQTMLAIVAAQIAQAGDTPDDVLILKLSELTKGKISAEQFSEWWGTATEGIQNLVDGRPSE